MTIVSLLHFGRSGFTLSLGCQFLIWLGLFGSVLVILSRSTISEITCRRVKLSLWLRRSTTGRCTDFVAFWVPWVIGLRSTKLRQHRVRNGVIWKFGTTSSYKNLATWQTAFLLRVLHYIDIRFYNDTYALWKITAVFSWTADAHQAGGWCPRAWWSFEDGDEGKNSSL